jgi:tripartite-type tricarboxylate transporter receptor subunit TctC
MPRTVAACLAGVLALVAGDAIAQAPYPTRAVKFVVPFPGGGINDILEHFPLRMKRNLGFGSSWHIHWA